MPRRRKEGSYKCFYDEKAVSGPVKNNHLQARKSKVATEKDDKAVATVTKLSKRSIFAFAVTFIDKNEFCSVTGRADDGAYESVVSSKIAENVVLNGNGILTKIDPVTL